MRPILTLCLLLLPVSLLSQSVSVIPYPREIKLEGSRLTLPGIPHIHAADESLRPLARLLADDIFLLSGRSADQITGSGADILLMIDPSVPENEYRISITDQVVVKGSGYLAVSQGVTTLIQLLDPDGGDLSIPKLTLRDSPANAFRSLLVDVARQVIDIQTLKQSVDLCRLYKIPYLQIHIADDQAFCFPSTAYPDLATPGHRYTREELRDLVDYAQIRGVAIIPELDGPGHSTAARKSHPKVFGSPEFSALDLVSDTLYKAMAVILKEMIEVFDTSPYFHIGADEAHLNEKFLNSRHVQTFMKKTGYSAEDLHRRYVVKMDSIVKSLGKKTMAWESFKADNTEQKVKIPTDILVNAWETLYELPQYYCRNGFSIVNSSWKPYYTTRDKRWHPEFIYNFSKFSYANFWENAPSYHPFDMEPSDRVIGGQMCAWEQLDAQVVAGMRNRIPAFSEYYWLEDRRPGYTDFEIRFRKADRLFDRLLTGCRIDLIGACEVPATPVEWHGQKLPNPNGVENNYQYWFEKELLVKVVPASDKTIVYYTTDGSRPTPASKILKGSLKITEDTHFQMIAWSGKVIGYQQFLFEHRPVRAVLEGIRAADREPEPYTYNSRYFVPLTIRFEPVGEPGIEIRYTLDGKVPDASSARYENPLVLTSAGEHTIRARAFREGRPYGKEWAPSEFYEFRKDQSASRLYRFSLQKTN